MASRLAADGCSPIYWLDWVSWRQDQSRLQQPSDGLFHPVELEHSGTKMLQIETQQNYL